MDLSEYFLAYRDVLEDTSHDIQHRSVVFQPILDGLKNCKGIYHESFTCVIEFTQISVVNSYFEAKVLLRKEIVKDSYLPRVWKIGASLSILTLDENLCLSGYDWQIWIDKATVSAVINLVENKNINEALNLTVYKAV